jgi:hypothetical protein
MTFSQKTWEQKPIGALNLYTINSMSKVADDLLRVESEQKDPNDSKMVQVVSEFGGFSSDGETMIFIQERKGNGVWKPYGQQFRKCKP